MRISRGLMAFAGVSLAGAGIAIIALQHWISAVERHYAPPQALSAAQKVNARPLTPFQQKIVQDLERQQNAHIVYRSDYFVGGKPPSHIGVCTDVVLRAYDAAGVDLQQAVNADIAANRIKYPAAEPNPNIDHRRCRNLVVYFRRHARALPLNADWQPGDIIFWDIHDTGAIDHVGVVGVNQDAEGNPSVVHHCPGLPVLDTGDLYHWTVRAHFRWKQSSG